MADEIVRSAIEEYFGALNRVDAPAWVETFAADGETHEPVGSPAHRGHSQLGEFVNNLFQRFERLQFTVDHVFIVGLQAAVKWTATGMIRGGNSFATEGIDVFVLKPDGKIQRVDAYWHPAVPGRESGLKRN
ncbi:MAG: nuclear transport factor 2 family protein [Acidobacteriota bacterium]|nr:nuclear transport factor 2 family protein [Acidobacteriota bacterium]